MVGNNQPLKCNQMCIKPLFEAFTHILIYVIIHYSKYR